MTYCTVRISDDSFVCMCWCDTGRHSTAADRRWPQSSRDVLSGLHPRLWRTFALQQHIDRGWGGKSPSNSQSQKAERELKHVSAWTQRNGSRLPVYLGHSTHNTHREASQVSNVVNLDCRFKCKGAPEVSFLRGKLLQLFMDRLEGRYDKKTSNLIIFSHIYTRKSSG